MKSHSSIYGKRKYRAIYLIQLKFFTVSSTPLTELWWFSITVLSLKRSLYCLAQTRSWATHHTNRCYGWGMLVFLPYWAQGTIKTESSYRKKHSGSLFFSSIFFFTNPQKASTWKFQTISMGNLWEFAYFLCFLLLTATSPNPAQSRFGRAVHTICIRRMCACGVYLVPKL